MTKVSVLISVYNGEKYLGETIRSVLDQSEGNFELVIVNDGSTDATDTVIKAYTDPRITYLDLPHAGRVPALNAGLKACQGEYIAILDADDIFEKDKLRKQIDFMESRGLTVAGTWAKVIDESGRETGEMTYPPLGGKAIRRYCLFHNPFIHSTVMMKREAVIGAGGYKPYRFGVEDYELWTRLIYKYKADNMPEALIKYRRHSSQATQSVNNRMRLNAFRVRFLALYRSLSRHRG
jgi:glycosyltransferase involved in cell wall biosynthesis